MQIGTALVLIAVGAILRFAITEDVAGIDLQVVGLILMVVGVVGLVISFVLMQRAPGPREREVVRERDRRY